MAKQNTVVSVDQLAAEILASLSSQTTSANDTPVIDRVADVAGGAMNAASRIAAAFRAAGTTAVQHYKLERTDQIDRQQVALAARAKAVAERMVARRQ